MNNEYIIVNKTSLEKKIEEWELELQECFKASIGEYNSDYVSNLQQAISITRELISISTPLIPEIEKAYIAGESSRYSHIGEAVLQHNYITNLKLDI